MKNDEHKDLNDDDILWAYQGIRRLQRFYAIPASDMSAGKMDDKIIGDRMDGKSTSRSQSNVFEIFT